MHASYILPAGRAYLTSLETFMAHGADRPFMPRTPPRSLPADLDWWTARLATSVSRPLPIPSDVLDHDVFSDASSESGVAITIGPYWQAWQLCEGWKGEGTRDIGWAEAIGFELALRALDRLNLLRPKSHLKVWGDNQGVVEGWWNGRSHNEAVNFVFRRIHDLLDYHGTVVHSRYVRSAENPADAPSRGILGTAALRLPTLELAGESAHWLIEYPRNGEVIKNLHTAPRPQFSANERARRNRLNGQFDDSTQEAIELLHTSRWV